MSAAAALSRRGLLWFRALTGQEGLCGAGVRTVRVADAPLGGETARYIAVVPDPANRFARARQGEVGVDEAWALARHVRATLAADQGVPARPIIAIVDVASQAYGRREELVGIHLAGAAAVDAYASARLGGHAVIALLVGKAMSGAFLCHGYQANRILALDSHEVLVHAMSKQAAARVTRRTIEEVERLGERILPMAYDVRAFARLGLVHRLIPDINADAPTAADLTQVQGELCAAIADARAGSRDLATRLSSAGARESRAASIEVRRRLSEQWNAS
jgi:malonate decarboxylase gamma subunit